MRFVVEVFRTAHMGWGIRAMGCIPRGAFMFEMTGEILTNAEQILRNRDIGEGPSYSVQMDADWAAERVLDDNSTLCLDASRFGNVARFLNHRLVFIMYLLCVVCCLLNCNHISDPLPPCLQVR